MKKFILFLICVIGLISCTAPDETISKGKSSSTQNMNTTRSISDTWSNYDYCILNGSSELVKAPWAENNVVTTIPSEIRKDVKEEDGWDILYSSMKINGYNRNYNYQQTDKSANYIIFYNHNNGLLKGFCYLTNPIQQNNLGLWHLSTNDSTRLFNFAGEEAIPYNGPKSKDVYISNITNESIAKGFNIGWNCFQIELAYDENSTLQTLNIDAISLNQTSYNFSGTMNFSSNGVIITTTKAPQNNILTGVATAIGEEAKKYIEKNIEQPNSNSTRGIAATTIGSLITSGVNKIFGSIFGKASSSTSEQTINITSKGIVKVKGTSTQILTGIVTPISDISLKKLGYALGVWNLLDYPTYQTESTATLQTFFISNSGNTFKYQIETTPSYKVILNPTQKNASTKASIVYQKGFNSSKSVLNSTITKIYSGSSSLPSLYTLPSNFNVLYVSDKYLPKKAYGTCTPGLDLSYADYPIYNQDTKLCIAEYIYNKEQFISAKTFKSKNKYINTKGARPYWWTTKELIEKGYKTNY